MTDLREELARAMYSKDPPYDKAYGADRVDAVLAIIARVRAEERERCAELAEDTSGSIGPSIAAAIRAMGDE